jgi:hypothetical protein
MAPQSLDSQKKRKKKKKKLEPTLKHQFKTWHKQGAMFHMFGGNLPILSNAAIVVYEFTTC